MDLTRYNLKDVILTAMKSEVDSRAVYEKLADRVENFMLKDRLKFLAGEEARFITGQTLVVDGGTIFH